MPGLYKDEGVVLRAVKLGEADRIITLYTRDHGKVRAVAKGIRKTKSRFGGRLESFTHVELMIYRGRNLDTITGAEIIRSFEEIRSDYTTLAAASAMAELVDKITPERERAWSTYTLLVDGLRALAETGTASVLPAFLVKLLSLSGYHPHLRSCAGCGGSPLDSFSAEMGGATCESCALEDPQSWPLGTEYIALAADLLAAEFGRIDAPPEAAAAVTRSLARYAEYHLERPLRSLPLATF